MIGATFRDNNDMSGDIRKVDDEFNIAQISAMLDKRHNVSVVESRVAGRCVTSDHLPIIGKLVDYTKFKENFYDMKGLKTGIWKIYDENGKLISENKIN